MIRWPLLVCLAATLAACGDRAPTAAPVTRASASPPPDVLARVAALPPRQRNGVLFRAIRDAGHDCQEVTEAKQQIPANGYIGWLATCDHADQWLVALDASGTATVIGAREAAKAQR